MKRKKYLEIYLILFTSIILSNSTCFAKGMPEEARGEYVFRASLPRLSSETIQAPDNNIYLLYSFDNSHFLTDTGKPKLPVTSYKVAVPSDAYDIQIEIVDTIEKERHIPFHIYPVEELISKKDQATGIEYIDNIFTMDSNFYTASADYYSENQVMLTESANIRGFRYVVIQVSHLQYRPSDKTLKTAQEINIKVSWETRGEATALRMSESFRGIIKGMDMLNYSSQEVEPVQQSARSAGQVIYPEDLSDVSNQATYLIITADRFYASTNLNNLAQHRANYSGFNVAVVQTSDIYTAVGSTIPLYPELLDANNEFDLKIKTFIKYVLENWDNGAQSLEYVLLVGDAYPDIETFYLPVHIHSESEIATDYWFSCINDDTGDGDIDDYDYSADLMIGRFSVQTEDQLSAIVNKAINYELNPPVFPAQEWGAKTLLTSGFFYSSKNHLPLVRDRYLIPAGTRVSEIYADEYCPDNREAALNEILSQINEGHAVFAHNGHGQADAWGIGWDPGCGYPDPPMFSTSVVATLNNADRLPVIFSLSCSTGKFDADIVSLAEAFVNEPNKGAVAFLGASRLSSASTDQPIADKMMYEIFKQENHILGSSVLEGKLAIFYYKARILYNLLGDPALDMSETLTEYATYISGDVGGQTWTLNEDPYIVTGDLEVPIGTTLTIESGVEVRFDGPYSLIVDGTLHAVGTPSERIIFTSNQADPAPEDWNEIILRASSSNSVIEYATVEYGFKGIWDKGIHSPATQINHSILRFNWSGITAQLGNAVIRNNTITSNTTHGIMSLDGPVFIENNIITNNGAYGVYSFYEETPTLSYNNVWGNGSGEEDNYVNVSPGTGAISVDPLFIDSDSGDYRLLRNSRCIDAGHPDSPFDPDGTFADMGAVFTWESYVAGDAGDIILKKVNNPHIVIDNVDVPEGTTLTIEPGVELRFDGYYALSVDGTLQAVGTLWDRIIFTSNRSSPAPMDWNGIIDGINTTGSLIQYANIEYAQYGVAEITEHAVPTMISHCVIAHNYYGIAAGGGGGNPDITNNTIIDNVEGITIYVSQPLIQNNIIINNSDYGINNLSPFEQYIYYNDVWENGTDYNGSISGEGNISDDPLLTHGYLLNGGSPCIDAGDEDSPRDPDGTIADIGAFHFIGSFVSGDVSGTWRAAHSPYFVEDDIWIPESLTLTIEPGVEVRFDDHRSLYVGGTLHAAGTPHDRIIFTASGLFSWGGIHFAFSSSDSVIEHATIEYAYWAIKDDSEHVNEIRHSLLHRNEVGIALRNTNLRIINNTIVHNVWMGIEIGWLASAFMQNNIIAMNNDVGIWRGETGPPDPTLLYNNVWGNRFRDYYNVVPGDDDISENPQFVGEVDNPYGLLRNSPCINAGDPASDRDPDGTIADMGAFYRHQSHTCFLPGTPILMSDGTEKSIEKVKVGDKVLAFDEETGEFKEDKVVEFFQHPAEEYLIINEYLKVTKNHPVYSNGTWVEIGTLTIGDELFSRNSKPVRITSIKEVKEPTQVYNLEVNPYHTYVAGGIVAHNKPKPAIMIAPDL
ncbi:C25 family cysteine peptidase [Candidatus Omnitrophota bacterium]